MASGYSVYERATESRCRLAVSRREQSYCGWLPKAKELKFRLSICFSAAICRLDYTDEYHPNSLHAPPGLPPFVDGPHYHSWPLNMQFFVAF